MIDYVMYNTLGVSQDTQLRILKILKAVIEGGGREIFEFGQKIMEERWKKLKVTFSASSRFSLQHVPSRFCTFYQRVREPSPAYAWVKCEREEDSDCYEVLKAADILGRKGQSYGTENQYVRLSLIKSQRDFDLLLQKLEMLMSISKDEAIIKG
ncbi:hypothetical protein BVRB_4g086580 [Beta vulgaris subsp. vulgaris]|nr:hypothetical protein BVRB_4g086580 [Beta vulgaris subsp. vulgaris]